MILSNPFNTLFFNLRFFVEKKMKKSICVWNWVFISVLEKWQNSKRSSGITEEKQGSVSRAQFADLFLATFTADVVAPACSNAV